MPTIATDLVEEILELKKRRNAVILAHNYQVREIQDLADHVGDSLGLAYKAAETEADVIVFCGVHFMGETAKIVNPTKTVVLPDINAGCSLSDSCPPEKLASFLNAASREELLRRRLHQLQRGREGFGRRHLHQRQRHQRSSRAFPPTANILFVPIKTSAPGLWSRPGRKMDLWQGNCYVHVEFTRNSINKIRAEYPDAKVVAHPECTYAVRMLADEAARPRR